MAQCQRFDGPGHRHVVQALSVGFRRFPATIQHEHVPELQPLGGMDGTQKQPVGPQLFQFTGMCVQPLAQVMRGVA